jgi:glycosyltransferase involved in cell wall biosynthesis
MKRKKILYLAPALPVGGAEMFLASLCNGLSKDDITQMVVSLSENAPMKTAFDPSFDLRILHRKGRFDTGPTKELRALIKREQPDLIFCLNFFAFFFARISARGADRHIPYIISYHSTKHVNGKDHMMHRIFPKLMRDIDKVVMVSTTQEEYTLKTYGIPRKRSLVIHNGIDPEHWSVAPPDFDKAAFRSGLGMTENIPVIAMTAAFREEKNHAEAIRALELLRSEHGRDAYFLLIGAGPLMEEVRTQAEASVMASRIIFAGPQKDVRPYLWSSNLFTLTSLSETFSMAALEAMGCGLPCVLTSIGGAAEMIEPGKNGSICLSNKNDLARAWHEALATNYDPVAIHDLIRNRFTRKKMMDGYRQVFGLPIPS